MDNLETKLNDVIALIQTQNTKAEEEVKLHGAALTETKATLARLQSQMDAIDLKLVDQQRNAPINRKSLKEVLSENDDINRLIRDKKGRAIFEVPGEQAAELMGQKTTLLSGGTGFGDAAAGVIGIERMPGIVLEARRKLKMRDVISARPTTAPLIYYVKVSVPLSNASPQVEGSTKFENAVQFTTVSTNVQTLATYVPASRQILDDFDELMGFLRTSLPYYVNRLEDLQILSGDGVGNDLNGLTTQASAFSTSLLSAAQGYTRIDQIGAASEQIDSIDEIAASYVVMNSKDWWSLRRTKDSYGRYILGDPQSFGEPKIWDLNVVSTNQMAQGTFLVGNGDPAAVEIRDRMAMQFDISTEDNVNFRQNLVTCRAEKRVALVVMRPASFVSGTFATSPAGL